MTLPDPKSSVPGTRPDSSCHANVINLLLDPGSMVEYGTLSAHSDESGWIPTRGGVDCVGTVHGFPVIVSSTDYTDHGGGYGADRINRLIALAHEHRWPMVLFADGGGSRASDPL